MMRPKLTRDEEVTMITGLVAGCPRTWRAFHTQYDRLLYRCIRKVTHSFAAVLRSEDEREIYANLMVQLLKSDMHKLRSFDPERGNRLSSWLGMLATHAAYDYLRSIRREVPSVPLTDIEQLQDGGRCPYTVVERKQRGALARQLIDSLLSPKDKKFVSLYFERGLEAEDVAREMNISVKTVYSKKHKIQARLEKFAGRRTAA